MGRLRRWRGVVLYIAAIPLTLFTSAVIFNMAEVTDPVYRAIIFSAALVFWWALAILTEHALRISDEGR